MSPEQLADLITGILISIFLIIGAIVLVYGLSRNRLRLTGFGAVLALCAIFLAFYHYPELGTTLSAFSAIALAVFAALTLIENRRLRLIREEEKERESKRRRLEELQGWIYEVVRIKTESVSPQGTDLEWRQRNTSAKILASKRAYVESEAARLDSEFATKKTEEQLVNIIGRVSFILEHYSSGASLSNEEMQAELEQKCETFLKRLSNIRTMGKL